MFSTGDTVSLRFLAPRRLRAAHILISDFSSFFGDKNQRRSSTASNNSCTQPGLPFLATVFVTRKSCCATFPEVPLIEHFHKKLDAWGWGYVNRREGGTGGAAVGGE